MMGVLTWKRRSYPTPRPLSNPPVHHRRKGKRFGCDVSMVMRGRVGDWEHGEEGMGNGRVRLKFSYQRSGFGKRRIMPVLMLFYFTVPLYPFLHGTIRAEGELFVRSKGFDILTLSVVRKLLVEKNQKKKGERKIDGGEGDDGKLIP